MTAPDSQLPWNIAEVFSRFFSLRSVRIELRISPQQDLPLGSFPNGWNRACFMGTDVEVVQVVRDLQVPDGIGLLHEVGDPQVRVVHLHLMG
jgi:hypothetical protein